MGFAHTHNTLSGFEKFHSSIFFFLSAMGMNRSAALLHTSLRN